MAKRKRLLPFGTESDAPEAMPVLETKAFPTYPLGYAGGHTYTRQAPIADMAGAAAATAAMEEMADLLRRAKEGGRMVLTLPLVEVEAGYLVRDRIATTPEDMAELVESLRARGQQTPIEVVQLAPGRYGLISGWRRLQALHHLSAQTGDTEKFGSVLALLRRPEQASDAYLAMVEENEIRVGLSFYERARIVTKAVELGVYPTEREALRGLFPTASRSKRSKIGSFITVVRALDGVLRFPEALGERIGLALAQALEADGSFGARVGAALAAAAPADPVAEQVQLSRLLAGPKAPKANTEKQAQTAMSETNSGAEPLPGLRVRAETGRLVIEGEKADAALLARLIDWLGTQPL